MNKQAFNQYRRSIRDNGYRYTLSHALLGDVQCLARAYDASRGEDMLAWRARWLANPDTSRANIIRLTSIIF